MIRLTDSEFAYLIHYVKEQYGIDLEKKQILIECRLRKELERYEAENFTKYFRMLEADGSGKMEEDMMHRLTTHYTYFYRESQHFEFVKNMVLPEVERTWKSGGYQVWCAGCSTGEEPHGYGHLGGSSGAGKSRNLHAKGFGKSADAVA